MMINELRGPGDETIVAEAWRLRLIATLRWTSAVLAGMAARLHRRGGAGKPELEFYAEAGAPEGALYVDGQRIGSLHGVNRL